MKPVQVVKILAVSMVLTAVMLMGWIGLVYAANTYTAIAITAEEVLNLILVGFVAVIDLPILHAATYRWFWHIRRKQAAGEFLLDEEMPGFGSEPTQPPPPIKWRARQIAVYALLYLVGMSSLIAAYAPFGHQEALTSFLWRFSAGRASFSSLVQLVIVFLPMALSFACIIPLFEADRKRLAAGGLSEQEVLGIRGRQEWLSSFATSFVMAGFLAFIAGNMILAYL